MSGRTPKMTVEERKEKKRTYLRKYRKTHSMSKESREKHNAYQREYRKRNPEKIKLYDENRIIKKAAQILAARNSEGSANNE